MSKAKTKGSNDAYMEVIVPFTGFYNSHHDCNLDYALDSMFSDDRGEAIQKLRDRAFDLVDWGLAHRLYAERFTECFSDEFKIDLTFKLLSSPKYYNFSTDRIVATTTLRQMLKVYHKVDKAKLRARVKERFTSCDGFISHYPNDLSDWPKRLGEWDLNQLETLLQVYVGYDDQNWDVPFDEFDRQPFGDCQEIEWHIIEEAMEDTPKLQKLYKVYSYMRLRDEREYNRTRLRA
jgi:hypothetical protein